MASYYLLLSLLCAGVTLAARESAPTTDSPYDIVEDNTDIPPQHDESACDAVLASHGLNYSSFWQGAAHGIHSLHLEEIQEYFEPEAPTHTGIPVVNKDLTAENIILFNAPLAGYDKDFNTMSFKVMAYFMVHDRPDFFNHGMNTLEKINHQFHMHELWLAAGPIYQRIKANPPANPDLCSCVNDITTNGVLKELVSIANQLKSFGRRTRGGRASRLTYEIGCGRLSYRFAYTSQNACPPGPRQTQGPRQRTRRDTTETIGQIKQKYLGDSSRENAEKVMTIDPWIPNSLTGPEQWVSFEAMLTASMLNTEELNNFATFMYCKLNQQEKGHAEHLFEDPTET